MTIATDKAGTATPDPQADVPSPTLASLSDVPSLCLENQRALATHAMAVQSAWIALWSSMQQDLLLQWQQSLGDPSRFLPQWMIWHNGTEEL